ncbi:MAG: glycosyltransferase family 9 protein [Desulfonatronovibrionaceae bacterium]
MSIDKLLLVHKGALGDFFLAWPAFLAVAQGFTNTALLWHGRSEFLPWLAPLGFKGCPPQIRTALDRMYSAEKIPEGLENCRILWFGVDKKTVEVRDQRLSFVRAVRGGREHVREAYQKQLADLGLGWPEQWERMWKGCFGRSGSGCGRVVLFPGSGHPAKNWPRVKFFELAAGLEEIGLKPVFVLGPAERGFVPCRFEVLTPRDVQELSRVVLAADAAVGNDCGPMHLAGNFRVPGVEIFGPTDARQWAARGMIPIASPVQCAPCSQTARIECKDPVCMQKIRVSAVFDALRSIHIANQGSSGK